MNNIDSTDLRKLTIAIYMHDAYLNGLIISKQTTQSKDYKKELKKLIKDAKLHSKQLNKLFKTLTGKDLEDRVLVTNTEKVKEKATVKEIKEKTNDGETVNRNKTKRKKVNKVKNKKEDTIKIKKDSTKYRDDLLENTKKAKNIGDAKLSNVVLETIECEYTIEKEPARLPVDCELLGVKCTFTPQHTMIIKAENKIPYDLIDNLEGLSRVTKSNITKALERQDLIKVKGENNLDIYLVTGDITCSNKSDAAKIILGKQDINEYKFSVGDIHLDRYLIQGK